MDFDKVERVAGEAEAEDGIVFVDGPDSVAVAMTPEAAREMAARLDEAANEADLQRRFKERHPAR